MSQLFPAWAGTALRSFVLGAPTALLLASAAWGVAYRSPYYTDVGEPVRQPVPFSHEHHVGGLGIDCRYCHTTVERSASAGMPATQTCMRCHSQIWTQASMLAPVRESYRTGRPLRWTRVNDLPDFVYFNHSIHLASGVACVTCHGRVDRMPLMSKAHSLHMRWCVECHRNPARYQRSPADVFKMDEAVPVAAHPRRLLDRNITDCTTCHR
jgi:hypothetical protein